MNSRTSQSNSVATPKLLRRGLDVIKAGPESALRFIIRDSGSGKQKILGDEAFFVLDQLSDCESMQQLNDAFADRFESELSQDKLEETLEAVSGANLWGRSAGDHPLVAPFLSDRERAGAGRRRRRAALRAKQGNRQRLDGEHPRRRHPRQGTQAAPASREPELAVREKSDTPESGPGVEPQRPRLLGDVVTTALPDEELLQEETRRERPGQEGPGQERPGQERPGQERPGQERPGQERPGQERPGQEGPGLERTAREEVALEEAALEDIAREMLVEDGAAFERSADGGRRAAPGNGPPGGQQRRVPGMRKKSIFPQWKLFKTGRLLEVLAHLLPLRGLALWSIPVLLVISGFILSRHTETFIGEFDRIVGSLSFIARVGLSLVTVNLVSTVTRGMAAYHFGMRTFDFGVRWILWFLPRFILGAQIDPKAPRGQQAWVAAMPLLAKLFLLGLGIVFWYLLRATDNALSHFFIFLAAMSAGAFVLTAFPLFPASGYQLLAILTNEPMLREKALGALKSGLTTGKVPEGAGILLMVFGFLTLLFLTLLIGLVFYLMGSVSQYYFQTTGILFSAAFLVFTLYKLLGRKQGSGTGQAGGGQPGARRGAGQAGGRQVAARRGAAHAGGGRQMQRRQPGRGGAVHSTPAEPPSAGRRLIKFGIFAALAGAMFVPYAYETGGELIMVPLERQDITTDVSGIIEKIYYEGGETLARGALIAQLKVDDAKRQINIHDARIKEQQAVIDRLLAKPTPEELEVALSALKVQQTKADYSAKDLARKEQIFKKNVISEDEVEKARREHEVDLGNVVEAEANVALVRAGATAEELLAAEAELARWIEERNLYQDIYDKSFLYMPIDGKLTTQFLRQKLGQYLNKGEVFAEAENTSSLLAEIEVPEFDAGLIRLSAPVRVRAWAFHEELFEGVVTKIDTNVEQRSFGNVVKVITKLENSDGRLKAGMTGYAKISGETRPVWEVLFMTIVRFVEVEMWSWIP